MQGWNREPKAVVEEFAKLCSETTTLYNLYWHLYEMDTKRLELYDQTAPLMFSEINHVLIRSLLLEFTKLTDKAKTMGHPNLTSNYIVEEVPWPDDVCTQLAEVNVRLMEFRKYIEPARSKRIAHTDLTSQMDKIANLGKFPKGAERKFLRDLQVFVDIGYGHLTNGQNLPLHVAMSDDVYLLVRALEKAELYDRCLQCDPGTRATALLDYEQGV